MPVDAAKAAPSAPAAAAAAAPAATASWGVLFKYQHLMEYFARVDATAFVTGQNSPDRLKFIPCSSTCVVWCYFSYGEENPEALVWDGKLSPASKDLLYQFALAHNITDGQQSMQLIFCICVVFVRFVFSSMAVSFKFCVLPSNFPFICT